MLWLFTDPVAMPDLPAVVAGLPRGLCGVVFRHDAHPDRAALARRIARLCRARRMPMVVAGDARLAAAVGAGLHLRGGRRGVVLPARGPITSSAHDAQELRRAMRHGAGTVFLSPVFATASHPGGRPLGVLRWSRLSRSGAAVHAPAVAALGGVDGRSVWRLPRSCAGAGAISALLPSAPCGHSATVFRNCHGDPSRAIAAGVWPRQ